MRKPKPTTLRFGVKTVKRRVLPEERSISVSLPNERALAWLEYIAEFHRQTEELMQQSDFPPTFTKNEGTTKTEAE